MDDNFSDDDDVIMAVLLDDDDVVIELETETISFEQHLELSEEYLEANDQDPYETINESLLEIESEDPQDNGVLIDTFVERRQQRFIAQSRSKKQWTAITLGVIAISVIVVFLVLESPFYNVDKVEVKNTSSVALNENESKTITSIANELKGKSMYRLNADGVLKKIKAFPTISQASVSKTWPGNVTVNILRRVPIAYIETDKAIVLIDDTGFVYEKVEKIPAGIPSFDGMDEITFTKNISDRTYIEVLKQSPNEIRSQIAHVRLDEGKYVAELTDGIDIILGDNTQLKEKLAIAWSVILAKKRSELGYIDVSVPTLPVSGSPQLKV